MPAAAAPFGVPSPTRLITLFWQVADPRVEKVLDAEELALYSGNYRPRLLVGAMISVLIKKSPIELDEVRKVK